MFDRSVQVISRLDSQSKFQMFTLFRTAMLVEERGGYHLYEKPVGVTGS